LAAATRSDLIRTLHDFLLSLEPIHGSAVLIIDEAQHLSPDVLEEIRILSNLETNERKLLLIVLVGQLNLLDGLRDAKLRSLDQRISIRCLLQPLTREGVDAYITHRLTVAGNQGSVVFTGAAIDLVYALSGGVPRVINLLCDRALMSGAEARTDKITDKQVREAAVSLGLAAAEEVPFVHSETAPRSTRVAVIALLGVLAALIAGYLLIFGNPFGSQAAVPSVKSPAPQSMGVPTPGGPPAPDTVESILPPNIETGAFSVIVGTFDTPRETETIAKTLRARGLPVYAVDLTMDDGVRRRRIIVGRFAAREDAVKARGELLPTYPEARLIYGWFERVP
jgi:general secretion pathway protein A